MGDKFNTLSKGWAELFPWAPDLSACLWGAATLGLAGGIYYFSSSSGGGPDGGSGGSGGVSSPGGGGVSSPESSMGGGSGPENSMGGGSDGMGTLAYPFLDEATYDDGVASDGMVTLAYPFLNEGHYDILIPRYLDGVENYPQILLVLEQASVALAAISAICLYRGFPLGTTAERLREGFPMEPCLGSISNPLVPAQQSYDELISYLNVVVQLDSGLMTMMSMIVGLQLLTQAAVEGVVSQEVPVNFLLELLTRGCPRPSLMQYLNPCDITRNCKWSRPSVVLEHCSRWRKHPQGRFYSKKRLDDPRTSPWNQSRCRQILKKFMLRHIHLVREGGTSSPNVKKMILNHIDSLPYSYLPLGGDRLLTESFKKQKK
jgi:hypothetical protein